jgi:hypothetical protein
MKSSAVLIAILAIVSPVSSLSTAVGDNAQDAAAANTSYIFASPNTDDSLDPVNAGKDLNSFAERNAISVADRIACSFTHLVHVSGTMGVFNGAAENSFVIQANLSRRQVEYVSSLLGKYEHQEFVLWFTPRPGGRDFLWTIRVPRSDAKNDANDVIAAMPRLHIAGATLRKESAATEIWVVDFGGKLVSAPNTLASKFRGKALSETGTAILLGDDDRTKAAALFQKKIDAFESPASAHLSALLESRWQRATARTCSSELPN